MLGAQLKDLVDPNDHALQVGICEWLPLPLMLDRLSSPELSGKLSNSVLPAFKDAHALIQLHSHIREA